jgi:N-formylglutamate deformylase
VVEPYILRAPAAAEVPLLVSIPHTGTDVPPSIAARFATPEVAALPDTDWHLHDLYDFVPQLGATMLFARYSRYIVDLNRPREGGALYPGRFETSVTPTRTFADTPIYRHGAEPEEDEITERLDLYWQPYHDRLRGELARLSERHGYALLFDAHSITSFVPRFSSDKLPGFMLGDVDGTSSHPDLSQAVLAVQAASGISFQPNHPFKGGYITRSNGAPGAGVHALQLEMSQRLYMDEGPPFAYRQDLAAALRPTLDASLRAFVETAHNLFG